MPPPSINLALAAPTPQHAAAHPAVPATLTETPMLPLRPLLGALLLAPLTGAAIVGVTTDMEMDFTDLLLDTMRSAAAAAGAAKLRFSFAANPNAAWVPWPEHNASAPSEMEILMEFAHEIILMDYVSAVPLLAPASTTLCAPWRESLSWASRVRRAPTATSQTTACRGCSATRTASSTRPGPGSPIRRS